MAEVDKPLNRVRWHKAERATSKLERVHVCPRGLQHVLQIALAHRGVIATRISVMPRVHGFCGRALVLKKANARLLGCEPGRVMIPFSFSCRSVRSASYSRDVHLSQRPYELGDRDGIQFGAG